MDTKERQVLILVAGRHARETDSCILEAHSLALRDWADLTDAQRADILEGYAL